MDPAALGVDRAVKLPFLDAVEGMRRLPALREFRLRDGVDVSGQLRGRRRPSSALYSNPCRSLGVPQTKKIGGSVVKSQPIP